MDSASGDIFHSHEIDGSKILQVCFWISLLGFFSMFSQYFYAPLWSNQAKNLGYLVCPAFFQDCHSLYFFDSIPYSYTQSYFFTILYCLIFASALFAYQRKWCLALIPMAVLFAIKFIFFLLLTDLSSIEFQYFHLPFVLVLLLFRDKLSYLKICYVLLFFLSVLPKLYEGWIVGSYFSSLYLGLAFVPKVLIPLATNFVILLEILAPWMLLRGGKQQKIALYALTGFHIYSTILVGYVYPTLCLPFLIVLFSGESTRVKINLTHPNLQSLSILLLLVANITPHLIDANIKYSLKYSRFGLNMFDANRQCISVEERYLGESLIKRTEESTTNAMDRCSVYRRWAVLKNRCEKISEGEKLKWSYYMSIDGNPFYELVSESDICNTNYNYLSSNTWINKDFRTKTLGYPWKNAIGGAYQFKLSRMHYSPNPTQTLSNIQKWLKTNKYWFQLSYSALFVFSLFLGLRSISGKSNKKG